MRRLNGHSQRVNSVELSADCSLLLSASYDKSILAWDLRSNSREPVQRMEDFTDSVTKVALTKETPGYIVGSCVDGSVRIYDLRRGCLHKDKVQMDARYTLSLCLCLSICPTYLLWISDN